MMRGDQDPHEVVMGSFLSPEELEHHLRMEMRKDYNGDDPYGENKEEEEVDVDEAKEFNGGQERRGSFAAEKIHVLSSSSSPMKTPGVGRGSDIRKHRQRGLQVTQLPQSSECEFNRVMDANSFVTNVENQTMVVHAMMWEIQAKTSSLDIVSLELDLVNESDEGGSPLRVYYRRVGNAVVDDIAALSQHYNSSDGWTLVAESTTAATPETGSFIVPVGSFTPIALTAKESIVMYVTMMTPDNSENNAKIYTADTGMNTSSFFSQDDALQMFVGIGFDDSNMVADNATTTAISPTTDDESYFAHDSFALSRQFNGAIHYKLRTKCNEYMVVTDMELLYFISDVNPSNVVIAVVTEMVDKAITKGMASNVELVRMQNFGGLKKMSSTSAKDESFTGSDSCPFEWTQCSKIITTITFEHHYNVDPGLVEYEVMKHTVEIQQPNRFMVGYAGEVPLKLDYFLTLWDVPETDAEMDAIEREYLAGETLSFLQESSGSNILAVTVMEQTAESESTRWRMLQHQPVGQDIDAKLERGEGALESIVSKEVDGSILTSTRQLKPRRLRPLTSFNSYDNNIHRYRSLQFTSTQPQTEVHVSIYGAYEAWPIPTHPNSTRGVDSLEVADMTQNAFDKYRSDLIEYLKLGLLRPGPLSTMDDDVDRTAFFADISDVTVEFDENSYFVPTAAPTDAPTMMPTMEYVPRQAGVPTNVWRVFGIILVILGIVLLLYSFYWDCQRRKLEKTKLKRLARSAQRRVDRLRSEQYRRIAENNKAGVTAMAEPEYEEPEKKKKKKKKKKKSTELEIV